MTHASLRRIAAIVLVALSVSAAAHAQANCAFSNRLSDTKFKSNKGVAKYVWNKDRLAAKLITKGGDLISAQYWSCNHYGAHAVMLVGPYPKDDLNAVGEKFAALADMTFETTEAKIVRGYVRKSPVTLSGETAQIDVPNTGYSEFYLRYTVAYDSVVLEIKFYKD